MWIWYISVTLLQCKAPRITQTWVPIPVVMEQVPEFRSAPEAQAPWPHLYAVLGRCTSADSYALGTNWRPGHRAVGTVARWDAHVPPLPSALSHILSRHTSHASTVTVHEHVSPWDSHCQFSWLAAPGIQALGLWPTQNILFGFSAYKASRILKRLSRPSFPSSPLISLLILFIYWLTFWEFSRSDSLVIQIGLKLPLWLRMGSTLPLSPKCQDSRALPAPASLCQIRG